MRVNLLLFSVLLITAWLLRMWLASLEVLRYQRQVRDLCRAGSGFVGSGRTRHGGTGAVAVILTDPEGRIQRATVMRGRTVFARFHDLDALRGTPVSRLIDPAAGRGVAGTRDTAAALEQAAQSVVSTMTRVPE